MSDTPIVVSPDSVERTIESFTALDESGDRRSMNKLARRLGKEQPALLAFAAQFRVDHGDEVGEAALFYSTLVWAMFDEPRPKKLPRLLPANLDDAKTIVEDAHEAVEGMADKPVHERVVDELKDRQPNVYAKLVELIEEDVREEAISAETASVIFPPTQIVVEAFDAALEGRRPGQHLGPVVRDSPKIGRNDPCPCGSGKKFKKCCNAA